MKARGKRCHARNTKRLISGWLQLIMQICKNRNIFRSETVHLLLRIIFESFKLHYFSETQVSCEGRYGRYDQINVKCPSVNLLSAHLQLVGLMNNMFINPEDLKSLVAYNNCDIRKSLLNLQFWSASRGGLKMPYKRPAHLNDSSRISDKNQTIQTSGHAGSAECVQTNSLSQDVPQSHPTMTGGVLDEGGEESMFLLADNQE